MQLEIPEIAIVLLVGASGAGKSTFARRHFRPTEVLSSDAYRAVVSDDENDQAATADAFSVLHLVAAKRLARGRLVLVDATNVKASARKSLVALARAHHCAAAAVVLALPDELCLARNLSRTDRRLPPAVILEQARQLQEALAALQEEGFAPLHVLTTPEAVDAARVVRVPMRANRRGDAGPFDLIGGVNGCFAEVTALLERLDYPPHGGAGVAAGAARHAGGRRVVFVGDLAGPGPDSLACLRLALAMQRDGTALCVPGDHDDLLGRRLFGEAVAVGTGLDAALGELDRASPAARQDLAAFLGQLPGHLVLDGGRLIVAHAGLRESMHGRGTPEVERAARYGDAAGAPGGWATGYRGKAAVIHAEAAVRVAQWLNNTLGLDTGCVYGGRLTALRYPERELVAVPAARAYAAAPGRMD